MDLRRVTGYVALALLAGYWVWILSRTSPELRRGTRDRGLRMRILLVKTAAVVLTALVVLTIHFWATAVWQVLVTVPVAIGAGYLLRRVYRRLVAVPRHRLPLAQRVRRAGQLHVIAPPHSRTPSHRVVAATVVPAPRQTAETIAPVTPAPGPLPATDVVPLSSQVTGPTPT
ncbi:hypothetical protein [Pseudonocardia endophytica]|uniref:Uncharacterized protein n=1 Tax=Pseudonocardia endophytica TaxID=401976 RepID=A0A4R1HVK7_PSEEN|nr:hypothetical protein [Pseudonocardia endophytica]TCK21512.1 hypothetical protein EV378_5500 [Pseudonocardia endophytica]